MEREIQEVIIEESMILATFAEKRALGILWSMIIHSFLIIIHNA
jgi:hypothetical protein